MLLKNATQKKLARPKASISDAFRNFQEFSLSRVSLESLFFSFYFNVTSEYPSKHLPRREEAEMQISSILTGKSGVTKNSKDSRHSA